MTIQFLASQPSTAEAHSIQQFIKQLLASYKL